MTLALKLYQQRSLESLERFLERARIAGPAKAFAATVDQGLVNTYKPLPDQTDVPYVCLRIPTGGGKTVMGAHIIQAAARAYLERELPLVLWLVPTTQIKSQTLDAFRDPRHPYRQELDDAFDGKVAVFDISDIDQIRPADLATKVCMVVATMATARVQDTELRDFYAHKEALEPHFIGALRQRDDLRKTDKGEVAFSFANLLAIHGPLVITDEAHNATTDLSFEVYKRLSPSAIVELTATPDAVNSNILVSVSAFELKAEDMIKLPVVLKEHDSDWPVAISAAVARRRSLADIAKNEPEYIRPILLIQAENVRGAATVEEVKKHLLEVDKVPEAAVAIATGTQREIDGVDLFAKDCPIEVIITKQALKEGWDCSFAYVFCSVAQVKSNTDVQQLLGRVLRMPYAKRRTREAMNKAYAHVVSPTFGEAAAELTNSLVSIGFNPIEALGSLRNEQQLSLESGQTAQPPALPTTQIPVAQAPDLTNAPERDRQRVRFIPHADGQKGGIVELTDEIDGETAQAIVAAAPTRRQDEVKAAIEQHQQRTAVIKAPSERGETFEVPRLCMMEQGELELVDRGAVGASFQFDLLDYPADLTSFRFDEQSMTYEVDLDNKSVSYHLVKEDIASYLPGFAQGRTLADLHGWLDQNLRDPRIKQPVMREWIRRALDGLMKERGFSLAQLLRGQFVLRRKLQEQLEVARRSAMAEGFQDALFSNQSAVVSSDDPGYAFAYPPDLSQYPARSYYNGSYRFQKHYYPVPGDLKWRTDGGVDTEEFKCARAIDMLDEVKFWVRNLVHPSQFWMPTAHARTYPDFVALLNDGRLLVVEYKGGDRFSNDDSQQKRAIGDLWAARSNGKAIYLMAQKNDGGRGLREQLLAAIQDH
ncbi:MAG: DEAD/DEAH box helicase family protein [Burkholderiaceae bacterium]|nr:DEAD/DEAH box helicase family protein [Burkholderiaceae bacterium]